MEDKEQLINSILKERFNFHEFLPGQREAINSITAGQDTLVVMPTGSGKSLCYQLSALLMEGTTLVISPLIALMKDQVDMLTRKGIDATYINSSLTYKQKARRKRDLKKGKHELIYVSPERLRHKSFLKSLAKVEIPILAVDEAHCISQWGHDFRPSYLHIKDLLNRIERPSIMALTATATPKVKRDILEQLNMRTSEKINTGFDRPNLELKVKYATDEEKKLKLLKLFFENEYQKGESGIVYVGTRQNAEYLKHFIEEMTDIKSCYYHAGLDDKVRKANQEKFLNNEIPVIVATNAFGMGIDKPDIRFVIHYQIPDTMERYYQEIGRAGRDGQQSHILLLYCPDDRSLQEWFIENSVPTNEEFKTIYRAIVDQQTEGWISIGESELENITGIYHAKIRVGIDQLVKNGDLIRMDDTRGLLNLRPTTDVDKLNLKNIQRLNKQRKRQKFKQLSKIMNYAESNSCRRELILSHFGDEKSSNSYSYCCDNCELSLSGNQGGINAEADRIAHKILKCVDEYHKRIGRSKVAKILNGSKAKNITEFGYKESASYNALNDFTQKNIIQMVDELIDQQYLKLIGGRYPVLKFTPRGESAWENKNPIDIDIPGRKKATTSHRLQSDTVKRTRNLFLKGLSPNQIASERNLTERTIYNHIAKLIKRDKIDIDKVVPKKIQRKIKEAISEVGYEWLTPIKQVLPEEISYEYIRCVVAAYKRSKGIELEDFSDKVSSYMSNFYNELSVQNRAKFVFLMGKLRESKAINMLINALKDDNANVRKFSAYALGEIGETGAVNALIDSSNDKNSKVRHYVIMALGKIGAPRALKRLKEISGDKSEKEYNRKSANRSLELIRKNSESSELQEIEEKPKKDKNIEEFISSKHPQKLIGNWEQGYALDFHSHYHGDRNEKTELGKMITDFKYHNQKELAKPLTKELVDFIKSHPPYEDVDIILGIPSSRKRAYQPVHVLALNIAKDLEIPYSPSILVKKHETKQQKTMKTLEQKRDNIKGAFRLNKANSIGDKKVLLIDDLVNSGETLKEATRILKRGDPLKIFTLVVTKTMSGGR